MPPQPQDAPRYGIGEWYGDVVEHADVGTLERYALENFESGSVPPCPFKQAAYPGEPCSKPGGVCTLRRHSHADDGSVTVRDEPFVTTCPNRFWQDNFIFEWIGEALLGTPTPILCKEVPFLDSAIPGNNRSVGQIDMVLVDPADDENWCALEMQAVYFSGDAMASHVEQYARRPNGLVFPIGQRRPDWRSSGPKRLMPQLQTKVPSLRRWGKKTAVVIDKQFLGSLSRMDTVNDISNSDIVWFIVDYDTVHGKIHAHRVMPVTLEESVVALTAGVPKSQSQFERELGRRKRRGVKMIPRT